jgi:hypothetical protein
MTLKRSKLARQRFVQRKSETLQHADAANGLETIQKRDEGLLINEEILEKGLLENPAFDRHSPYYSNFPQNAVKFSPRRPFHYDPMAVVVEKQEPSDVNKDNTSEADRSPPKTEKIKPRNTFSVLCPTSIECPDRGCCAVGTYCTVVNGIVGYCNLPVSVFPGAVNLSRWKD